MAVVAAPWMAASAAIFLATGVLKNIQHRRKVKHIPLVSGHKAIVGRYKTLGETSSGKLHMLWQTIAEDADAKNAGMLRICVMGETFIALVTPDVQSVIYNKAKGPGWVQKWEHPYRIFNWLGTTTPTIVDEPSKDEHARIRKEMARFFCGENIESVTTELRNQVQKVCDYVAQLARDNPDGSGTIVHEVRPLALEIMAMVVLNVLWDTDGDMNLQTLNEQLDLMDEVASSPLKRVLYSKGLSKTYYRTFRPNWHKMRATWERLVRTAFERQMDPADNSFWCCMRRAFPEAMTNKREWHRCVSNACTTFFAGSETTQAAIVSILASIVVDGDSLRKLEEELEDAGLLVSESNPSPRLPHTDDLRNLRYLDAVFHEGLRYWPPAPSGTWRKLSKALDTPQGPIPAGYPIFLPAYSTHHSKQVWGEDADEWKPDRWLVGRSSNQVKKDSSGNLRWYPFTDGIQNCVGFHLGTLETKLAVAMFVARFNIRAGPELAAYKSVPELKEPATSFITFRFKGGLPLTFEPRVGSR